jgi:ribonuclease-3
MKLKNIEKTFIVRNKFKEIFFQDKKNKKKFQRYEFLGDRVIGLTLATELHSKFKNYDEGKLATIYSYLSSAVMHQKISTQIELDLFIKRKKINISTKVLSDFLEAVIGALYVDSGFKKTNKVILQLWEKEILINKDIKRDAKSILQEWTQSNKLGLPDYQLMKKKGSDHNPVFEVKIMIKDFKSIKARGKSLQLAQMNAAKIFINTYIKDT